MPHFGEIEMSVARPDPVTRWYWKGDRMDYGIAVESLLIKREKAICVPAEMS